ncbi:HigA family addiction module antitoxin [uncultured Corynebacterium sp.]|uniref:HigA family addiction module antitoxin n=1 Tax=uncultured Corynebacterium sp. TaxID=159447 RepID=UPI0025F347A3|nr:HigA family addiction module antitoxin [uncultured Corynebacterium sp.]
MMLPTHNRTPGAVLDAEFLAPLGLDADQLAAATGLPPATIAGLIAGTVRIDDEIAACLGDFLGTDARFWIALQLQTDRGLMTA